MSTIVTRSGKGSPLTHVEVDANFSNLNTDKIQSGNTVAALTITALTTPSVQAVNSAGLALKNSAGTTQMSMGAGSGDNMAINVSTNLNGTNAQIDISPTGTGHVHIKPTGVNSVEISPTYVGEMDNITIGATTAAAGSFTNLSVTGTTSFDGSQGTAGQVLTSAGTGNTPTWATVSGSISVTGSDLTLSGNTGTAITNATLATVNSNTGSFGSTTSIPVITVNGKGLITGVTTASVAGGAALSNDTTTATNLYPLFAAATTGTPTTIYTSNSKYLYKPSTGDLQASQVVASNGLIVNNATVAASYSIASGNNAMSVGPITVATGQSVTVASGQRWVVL